MPHSNRLAYTSCCSKELCLHITYIAVYVSLHHVLLERRSGGEGSGLGKGVQYFYFPEYFISVLFKQSLGRGVGGRIITVDHISHIIVNTFGVGLVLLIRCQKFTGLLNR